MKTFLIFQRTNQVEFNGQLRNMTGYTNITGEC
jgi:hypothetical protein